MALRDQIQMAGEERKALQRHLVEVTDQLKQLLSMGAKDHMSEKEMATLAGVGQATVAKWVLGKTSSDYRDRRGHCTYPHGKCLKENA